jgi:putative ABC transport system ATP-binding protein
MAKILELKGVSKDFPLESGSIRVLDGIELDIMAGTLTVIVGPSGAGKSTLLNLMGGLDRPTAGSIQLEGRELATASDRDLTLIRRRRIGIVFQFFNLLPNLTTWHNIAMPLLLDAVSPASARQHAEKLAVELGISMVLDMPARLLSAGEMQRAAIARALVQGPALVLADEPTGNLDASSGKTVLDLLQRAVRRQGHTVVLVTHDFSALPGADHLVQLIDGKIASQR